MELLTNKICHITPNNILLLYKIYYTHKHVCNQTLHIYSTATGDVSFYMFFYLKTGVSILTLYLYIQKQIINSLKHFFRH